VYLAYAVSMSDTVTTMGARELREKLGQRIDAAHWKGEPTIAEKNGEPRAVLIPYAEWLACQSAEVRPPSPPA
jgi:prevent-host-death family protein